MVGGNTQETPDFSWKCDSGISQEPFQTLRRARGDTDTGRFCTELTFPEQKGWVGNIKKPFSLHNAKLALSVENDFVNHHIQEGDGRVRAVGSQPRTGWPSDPWCLVWFHDEFGLLNSSMNPRTSRCETKTCGCCICHLIRTLGCKCFALRLFHASGTSPGSPSASVMSTRVQCMDRKDVGTLTGD